MGRLIGALMLWVPIVLGLLSLLPTTVLFWFVAGMVWYGVAFYLMTKDLHY